MRVRGIVIGLALGLLAVNSAGAEERRWSSLAASVDYSVGDYGTATVGPATGPLRVLTPNPRYFTDGSGKAIALGGSHVWHDLVDSGPTYPPAPFEYSGYLDFLVQHGHNFIRGWGTESLWMPNYQTYQGPVPYLRTGPGVATDGRPRVDLNQFDQTFFDRLRQRAIDAGNRGIYLSFMFYSSWSNQDKTEGNPWGGHVFNGANNINGVDGDLNGNGMGEEVETLASPTVTSYQKAYIAKVIDTLGDLDNVLYEISNEADATTAVRDWQYELVNYIHSYEAGKPKQHPVGMTSFGYTPATAGSDLAFSNQWLFSGPADWIAPFGAGSTGYATNPPASTGTKVILVDTDHVWGIGGDRVWVWKSFTRGLGTQFMDPEPPLYTDTSLANVENTRYAIGDTLRYGGRMDLANMTPRGDLSSTTYCLASVGMQYLVYQPGSGSFSVTLPAGSYSYEWFNPSTRAVAATGTVSVTGTSKSFNPPFSGDAVLYLVSQPAPPPPSISSIAPTSAARGASVTVSGAHFTATGNTVNVGTAKVQNLSSDGATVVFIVPKPAKAGSTTVTVTNANGQSNSVPFTVLR
jgi:IPT/TIG domain/Family of unknown function (DUF6298)